MINAVIRKLVNLIDSSASEGQRAGLLVDELGRLHVTSSGGQPAQPAAATAVGSVAFIVDDTEAALAGSSSTGWTLLNASTGGQVVYLGDTGVDVASGFPLEPGDALDRAGWQDLSVVHAIASAAGADLRAVPL